MMPYKTLRKLVLTIAFLFILYTIHNIVLQGNNLYINSRSRDIWINSLGRNVTRKSHNSDSISRLLIDRLNKSDHRPSQKSEQNDYIGSERFIINILSNSLPNNVSVLQNKTHIFHLPINKLNQLQNILNETYLENDTLYSYKPGTETVSDQVNNTFSDKHTVRHLEFQNDTDVERNETDGNSESEEIEDENNEFDITDLDDHITFPAKRTENKQESQVKTISGRNQLKWNGQYDIKLNNTPAYRQQIHTVFKRPIQNPAGIDCNQIVEKGKENEIMKAKYVMEKFQRRGIATDKYARTRDCENFRGGRGYIEHPLSQMELDFPLAFGITAYKDVEQAERLLRAIYRPHNFYCFHLDSKMQHLDRKAFESIVRCFDNVFISDRSVNVTWGKYSVLEAELLCMEKLWQHKKWIYYINLTGQEFPLKTNREIVAILDALDGANIVDGTWIRARQRYFYRWTIAGHPPPHKIRPIKGSVHVAVNRHFVDFALHDERALDFLEWLKKTQIPDETFFASLNHNPHLGINGSFLGEAEEYPLKPSLMRYKNWEFGHAVFVRGCAGKYVRNVCVLGVGDLQKAYNDIGLFVNKFNLDFEYLALDCLEEILYKKTWDQYVNDVKIDTNYYKHLDYVKKKLFVPPQNG